MEEDRDVGIKSPERTNRFKSKGMKGKGRLWQKKNGMKYENKNVMKFIICKCKLSIINSLNIIKLIFITRKICEINVERIITIL